MNRGNRLFVLAFAVFCTTSVALADNFPTRPVRWVVPYAAGGPTDTISRVVAQRVTALWGQQIVIDMRPGANSIIGTDIVAHAQPDGYTLLVALPALAINPSFYPKLPYDTLRDFSPVTLIGSAAYVVVVPSSLPLKSIQDLVALARSRPDQVSFGSGGVGSPAHLALELLQQKAGIRMTHVPYKGGAPALVDLASGRIQVMANPIASSMSFIKAGRLRAIAVTSANRSRMLPDIPTVAEAGIGSYEVSTWYGLFAPAKTPRAIVQTVANSVSKALKDADVEKRLAEFDVQPVGNDPAEFARFVREEISQWGQLVRAANVKGK